ncbi:MAG: cob(I)yrinic acid a,c-diamide adenosyltransferase [Anaerolineaceae bacterium]|nr:cob(I)yrinic acid a,c-diamide adenosyltransferase [Anaerolineaceae bacterium]
MASIFTRAGDEGYTGILGKGRVPKYDLRLEAVGTLDEANACLGVARHHCQDPKSKQLLIHIQHQLYTLMGEIAATPENAEKFSAITSEQVDWLEECTNKLTQTTKFPSEFIVPGDTLAGAALDVARTVVRRSERRVVELFHQKAITNSELLRYLNRLSSFLFALELSENQFSGRDYLTLGKDLD